MFGANLHVTLDSPEAVPTLEASLRQRGITIQHMQTILPSLEDVFVSLVGRQVAT